MSEATKEPDENESVQQPAEEPEVNESMQARRSRKTNYSRDCSFGYSNCQTNYG